jgi:hypothetical protein
VDDIRRIAARELERVGGNGFLAVRSLNASRIPHPSGRPWTTARLEALLERGEVI